MITLYRFFIVKQKEMKWKAAFWQFFDRQISTLAENPEELEKVIVRALAEIIHDSTAGTAETGR